MYPQCNCSLHVTGLLKLFRFMEIKIIVWWLFGFFSFVLRIVFCGGGLFFGSFFRILNEISFAMQRNNIEHIATYHDVMKYHPVPSRNGPITNGVSFLNLEFILPHTP